ncbi:hypothetical protein OROMI_018625 [Orobanche minor]
MMIENSKGDKRPKQIVDDDDFDIEKENIPNYNIGHKRSNACNGHDCDDDAFDGFPMMACRTNPQVLVNTIEKLNDIQKKEIVDMGFGHILLLSIKEVPSMLGYWVVNNFNPITCEIKLQDGRRLHIDDNDVYRVFGLPKGKRSMPPHSS